MGDRFATFLLDMAQLPKVGAETFHALLTNFFSWLINFSSEEIVVPVAN